MHFLGGWVQDTDQFGYLFTPPFEGIHTFLFPSDDVPTLRSGRPTFEPSKEQFFVETPEQRLLTLKHYFAKQNKRTRVSK